MVDVMKSPPKPPAEPPHAANLAEWKAYALAYLGVQLGADAPSDLSPPQVFPISPLEGEGPVAIFPFRARRGASIEQDYFVAVGMTTPNYYPSYERSTDEAFSLHLGTRFMLVMGVAQRQPPTSVEFDIEKNARMIVDRVQPGAPIEDLALAAAFDVEGQLHAVLKCRVAGTPVYIMAGDAPMGFSTHVDLPPQAAYRIHLGQALRLEPSPGVE